MNYNKLNTLLQGRCCYKKKIANNTWAIRREVNIAICLHNTDILTFSPNGFVRYNTGGWETVTTKARMNEYGPAHIHQRNYQWYITFAGQVEEYFNGIGFLTV